MLIDLISILGDAVTGAAIHAAQADRPSAENELDRAAAGLALQIRVFHRTDVLYPIALPFENSRVFNSLDDAV